MKRYYHKVDNVYEDLETVCKRWVWWRMVDGTFFCSSSDLKRLNNNSL